MRTINHYLVTCLHRNQISKVLVEMNRFEFSIQFEFTGKFNTEEFRKQLNAVIEIETSEGRDQIEITGLYLLHSETLISTTL